MTLSDNKKIRQLPADFSLSVMDKIMAEQARREERRTLWLNILYSGIATLSMISLVFIFNKLELISLNGLIAKSVSFFDKIGFTFTEGFQLFVDNPLIISLCCVFALLASIAQLMLRPRHSKK